MSNLCWFCAFCLLRLLDGVRKIDVFGGFASDMCLFVVEHGYDVAVSGRGNSLATGTYKKFRIESTFGKLISHKPKVGRKGPL